MELKQMSNQEIAKRVYDYFVRIEKLKEEISKRLDRTEKINEDYVREEYKSLKDLIKSDAKHLDLLRNRPDNKNIVQSSFWWGICEASAFGFTAKCNSKIDFTMWSSLEEASYKLNKYLDEDEWRQISEGVDSKNFEIKG